MKSPHVSHSMRAWANAKYRPLWIGALALLVLPLAMRMLGLTVNTATLVVVLAIAAMGLNLLVGYTGLTSFGHSAWFGIGAYAAALAQKHWFHDQIALPILFAIVFVAVLSTVVGVLILRRRGVYFSLLTLALAALTYTIAFRWTEVTGGEDGLGGLTRGSLGPINLDDALVYYIVVAGIGLGVLYALLRVTRSPFGHVLVAIRENQLRATFQGYPVERYKLAAFVLSAMVTGLAGALLGFQNYLVSADATSIAFSGELLAMVVIGGMHHILGPALGVLFYILFRELVSIWTANWLLWFGLVFVGFVLYSPSGLVGIWATLRRRWRPAPEEAAAMSKRRIYEGLPLPAFLCPAGLQGTVLQVDAVSKRFDGIRAVSDASLDSRRRRDPCPDRPERRRQDDPVQPGLGPVPAGRRHRASQRCRNPRPPAAPHLPARPGPLVPDHQPVPRPVDLREPAPVAAGAASRALQRLARHRRLRRRPRGNRRADPLPRPSRASRRSRATSCPTAGSGWWTSGLRSAPSRSCCCWTSRSPASRRPSASACRAW